MEQKSSNTLIIYIIVMEYLLINIVSNNKKYRECKINKLMQIKRIYSCAK